MENTQIISASDGSGKGQRLSNAFFTKRISTVIIPDNGELSDLFKQFILKWSGLPVQNMSWMENQNSPMPQEWELMFTQPLLGILIIRTTLNFEIKAREYATGRRLNKRQNEFLEEMVVLFWRHFAFMFWNLETRKIQAALFKKSVPSDWPKRKPEAACFVIVADCPIEVRLWAPVSETEMMGNLSRDFMPDEKNVHSEEK